jgi:hypothetical protein
LFESFTANDRFFETKVNDFLRSFERKFIVSSRSYLPPFGKSSNDPAQVLNIMKSTNFCEILSLLYGILIHEIDTNNQTITENNNSITTLHEKTIIIVINSMLLLNTIAILDLDTFQVSR